MMTKEEREPCFNCADRHAGCHSDCVKYFAYKERRAIVKAARDKQKDLDTFHTDYAVRLRSRIKYQKYKKGR